MTGLIFIDLKKLSKLQIMKLPAKNYSSMVVKTESLRGSNLTCVIGNSVHEPMVLIRK